MKLISPNCVQIDECKYPDAALDYRATFVFMRSSDDPNHPEFLVNAWRISDPNKQIGASFGTYHKAQKYYENILGEFEKKYGK